MSYGVQKFRKVRWPRSVLVTCTTYITTSCDSENNNLKRLHDAAATSGCSTKRVNAEPVVECAVMYHHIRVYFGCGDYVIRLGWHLNIATVGDEQFTNSHFVLYVRCAGKKGKKPQPLRFKVGVGKVIRGVSFYKCAIFIYYYFLL